MSQTITEIADTLRAARDAAGLSQGEAAKKIGVSRSWLSQFERGATKGPALDRILALADSLDVAVAFNLPIEAAADSTNVTPISEAPTATTAAEPVSQPIAEPTIQAPLQHHASGLAVARAQNNTAQTRSRLSA